MWEEAIGVEVGLRDGEVRPCSILNDDSHLRVTDHEPPSKLQTLDPPR